MEAVSLLRTEQSGGSASVGRALGAERESMNPGVTLHAVVQSSPDNLPQLAGIGGCSARIQTQDIPRAG